MYSTFEFLSFALDNTSQRRVVSRVRKLFKRKPILTDNGITLKEWETSGLSGISLSFHRPESLLHDLSP